MQRLRQRRGLALAAGLSVLAPAALAGFTNPSAPSFRGQPDTQYAGWESFTSAFGGDNLPDDPLTTSANAVIRQLAPGAILIGGGNVYHPSTAPVFVLEDDVPTDLLEVHLQTSTKGAELDYANVRLVYVDGGGAEVALPFDSRTELANNPVMGVDVESLFVWDLTGVVDEVTQYELRFEGAVPHVSLDAVLLDTRFAPSAITAFCFGDGSGTVCPCGNGGAPGRGCANGSSADGALLVASGTNQVAAGDLVLTASDLPAGVPGLFFQGVATVNGGSGSLFGDGLRCAGGQVTRLEVAVSDGNGDVSSTTNVALAGGASSGTTLQYQLWYRDANGSVCGAGFNTTNGLAVTWQ